MRRKDHQHRTVYLVALPLAVATLNVVLTCLDKFSDQSSNYYHYRHAYDRQTVVEALLLCICGVWHVPVDGMQ